MGNFCAIGFSLDFQFVKEDNRSSCQSMIALMKDQVDRLKVKGMKAVYGGDQCEMIKFLKDITR